MVTAAEALKIAIEHHQAGRLDAAEDVYRRIVTAEPTYAEAWHLLSVAYHERGQSREASGFSLRAVELNPSRPEYHLHLGNVWVSLRKLDEAVASLERALVLDPELVAAYNNLGNVRKDQGRLSEAIECYQNALRISPGHLMAHNNLGVALKNQGRLNEAIAAFQAAIALQPDFAMAHNNLGNALNEHGRLEEAVASYERAVVLKPDYASAHYNLGMALQDQGRLQEASVAFRRAARHDPDDFLWELKTATLCPAVFSSNEAAQAWRAVLEAVVRRRCEGTFPGGTRSQLLSKTLVEPPLNAQFLSGNLREFKESYARMFREWFPKAAPRTANGTPRVGMLVTRGHERSFVKSLRGVLERMDRSRFEVVIICHPTGSHVLRTQLAPAQIKILPVAGTLNTMAAAILAMQLDVLYYWEVGTDALNYFLPFYRLAPVQCTSWGIQVTSGVSEMDFYLSSQLVEADDAAEHYSEHLLLANTLLTYRDRESLPPDATTREQFGFARAQHLYVCPQHLGKLHPDFDPLLAEILRRDPRAVIVVIKDKYGVEATQLRARLAVTLADLSERVVLLPRLHAADYLSLTFAADVLLDPPHFGGVNTTYDALSFNKPIVTMPSAFHRGRYTLGCYKKMGLSDCVASTPEQYVDIAVRLATEFEFRHDVERSIEQQSPALFADDIAVREHERLFSQLIEVARSSRGASAPSSIHAAMRNAVEAQPESFRTPHAEFQVGPPIISWRRNRQHHVGGSRHGILVRDGVPIGKGQAGFSVTVIGVEAASHPGSAGAQL